MKLTNTWKHLIVGTIDGTYVTIDGIIWVRVIY